MQCLCFETAWPSLMLPVSLAAVASSAAAKCKQVQVGDFLDADTTNGRAAVPNWIGVVIVASNPGGFYQVAPVDDGHLSVMVYSVHQDNFAPFRTKSKPRTALPGKLGHRKTVHYAQHSQVCDLQGVIQPDCVRCVCAVLMVF